MEKEGVSWVVLESSTNAIVITDLKIPVRVSFWNKRAEEVFGYERTEVLGGNNPTIPDTYRNELKFIRKEVLKGDTLSYRSKRSTKEGKIIDVLVKAYPYKRGRKITGIITKIQPLAEIKDVQDIVYQVKKKQTKKRSFFQIRNEILSELLKGENTINELSLKTNINWRTVESHLVYLVGRALIKEIFSSEYVRIFRITERGRLYALNKGNVKINGYNKLDKKTIKI